MNGDQREEIWKVGSVSGHSANFRRLGEHDTARRRAIMDALEVLRAQAGFTDKDIAHLHVGSLLLPSSQTVRIVQLIFYRAEVAYVIALPAAASMIVTRIGARHREPLDMVRLHGATVDGYGHVQSTCGMSFRGVEVIPRYLPVIPSPLDWRLAHLIVEILGARGWCYRFLRNGLELPYRWMVSTKLRALNCEELPKLELPLLKVVLGHIRERDPTLKRLSPQKLADTLRMFGIRLPVARPRRKWRHADATI